ncbi:hypothetical protein [Leisingera sp. M658]|uniref:hypothetical protein n=1 Tax=Leisingera sp. M658 TaxID=2867015 RepID=UPI0021A7898D|nr:hypothetical protein [Leisingera sp. M658]UWQ73115.1 hypothetical protein K3724_10995 [Leisingera sp. M658]
MKSTERCFYFRSDLYQHHHFLARCQTARCLARLVGQNLRGISNCTGLTYKGIKTLRTGMTNQSNPSAKPAARAPASAALPRETALFALAAGVIILASRLLAAGLLDIRPDPIHLDGSYQHLPAQQLHDGLLDALLTLHSQPPFWNFLLGIAAKACGAQDACMIQLIWSSHLVLSVLTAVCMFAALRLLAQSRRLAWLLPLTYILSPAVFYYENFLLYAHFTSAFFTLSCLCALLFLKSQRTLYFLQFCACLAVLSLTWTLFHPIYILLVAGLLLFKTAATPARSAILVLTLAVTLLPSVKNKAVFGIFSSGSWLGLNASQTAPEPIEGCSFKTFAQVHGLIGQHTGTALNDPRMIPYSKTCLKKSLEVIAASPVQYAAGVVVRASTSLSLWPNEYFYPPLNWDRFPKIPDTKRVLTAENKIIIDPSISRFLTLALNLFALIALAELARRDQDHTRRAFFQVMLLSVVLFLGVAHAVNGPEQERMRYTLHPLFWGLYAVVFQEAARRAGRLTRRIRVKTLPETGSS